MSNSKSSGGVGCLTVLGLIFLVLKLVGTITWPWFWVLFPFIFELGIAIILLIVLAVLTLNSGRKY